MNKFSERSKERLNTCHRDLKTLFNHVILERDCTIVCGQRNKTDQDKAFTDGNSKVQWPNSKHNRIPSLAVDVAPLIRLDEAIKNLALAGFANSFNKKISAERALADELIAASKNDSKSASVKRRDEVERVAKASR